METARARHRFPMVNWEAQDELIHNAYLTHSPKQFGYVEDFSRGYSRRSDGTLAGLVIGTIAGVVAAAVLLGNVISPMW